MRARGFTLMEVMVSLGIVAVLAALVWGSFTPTWQAKEFVAEQAEHYHSIRLALGGISRDVSMAFLSKSYDLQRFRERPTHFVGDDSGDNDTLRFTTLANERLYEDSKESDQIVVEYRIDTDPEDRNAEALIRRVKTVIDDQPDRDGIETVVARGIEGLNIEYWDPEKDEWENEWDTTQVEHANKLPERVRITVLAKGDDGKVRKFSTQATVFMRTPIGN